MKKLFYFLGIIFWLINTAAAKSMVVFSEIAWMGTDASAYDEWIELYSHDDTEINLDGWTIESEDQKLIIPLSGYISAPKELSHASRFFLLERTDDSTTNLTADQIYKGALKNDGVQLFLKDHLGNIIDKTPPKPWASGSSKPKKSMERIDFTKESDNINNWNTFNGASNIFDAKGGIINGSPKHKNSQTPVKLFEPKPTEFIQKEFSANILQIAPNTFKDQAEWFSIEIKSESAVDVSDWIISNGKTEKKFTSIFKDITWIGDAFYGEDLSGKTHKNILYAADRKYLLPKRNPSKNNLQGIFYFKKSPVSLSDQGGTLILKNKNGVILDEKIFPKAIKTTIDETLYRETFIYKDGQIRPLLQTNTTFRPADFITNQITLPSAIDEIELFLSEIATNRFNEPDFIEIFVQKAPINGANIKYTQIKHNGSKVLFFPDDYIVHTGDFLLIYFDKRNEALKKENKHIFSAKKRSTLSKSGTIELEYFANTSQKILIDSACWYESRLNKTETKRVKKLGIIDTCQSIQFSPQESWAKNNAQEPYFRHQHGTPGATNQRENIQNFRPVPIITKQKSSHHSINVTGTESFDPNGNWDLQKIHWDFKFGNPNNEKTFQTFLTINPISQSLEFHKYLSKEQCLKNQYKIELQLIDTLGLSAKNHLIYSLYWDNSCKIGTPKPQSTNIPLKKWTVPTVSGKHIWERNNFFSDFKKNGHLPPNPKPSIIPKKIFNTQYEQVLFEKRIKKELIKKNIGLIFKP